MFDEGSHEDASPDIPDSRRLVRPASDDPPAIGTEAAIEDYGWMCRKGEDLLSRPGVPDEDTAVVAEAEDSVPLRAEGPLEERLTVGLGREDRLAAGCVPDAETAGAGDDLIPAGCDRRREEGLLGEEANLLPAFPVEEERAIPARDEQPRAGAELDVAREPLPLQVERSLDDAGTQAPEADQASAKRWQASDPNAAEWPFVTEKASFDGLTATPDSRYRAMGGRLVVTTPPSYRRIQQLWTTREFPQDFVLKLEFRATPNADSGLYVRGPQLQVRDYLLAGPYKQLKSYRPQDWNEVVVTVQGGLARATCNGELLEAEMKVPASGPIGLEGDRGQMEYRRIRIQTR